METKIRESLEKHNPDAPKWALEMAQIYYSNILKNRTIGGEWKMRLSGVPGRSNLVIRLVL